jgi:GntR family transcriptional regulator, transcriptional repressor for pyruvate dehydrogenase complex
MTADHRVDGVPHPELESGGHGPLDDRPSPQPAQARSTGGVERFPVFRHEALYQRIASHVRQLIVSEQLRPGERLPAERELARMLGVSRVPIREAMRTLAAQGLVEIRRGQGMFVADSSVDATVNQLTTALLKQRDLLAELFAVRRLLEPASAQWAAARADPEEVNRLERIVADMRRAGEKEPPDCDTIGERDTQLHVEIAVAADNRVLVRIMQAIQDLHREQLETSLHYRDRVEATLKDHARIVRAIAAGDPVEARSAMLDHLANSEAATMARIEGEDERRPGLPELGG